MGNALFNKEKINLRLFEVDKSEETETIKNIDILDVNGNDIKSDNVIFVGIKVKKNDFFDIYFIMYYVTQNNFSAKLSTIFEYYNGLIYLFCLFPKDKYNTIINDSKIIEKIVDNIKEELKHPVPLVINANGIVQDNIEMEDINQILTPDIANQKRKRIQTKLLQTKYSQNKKLALIIKICLGYYDKHITTKEEDYKITFFDLSILQENEVPDNVVPLEIQKEVVKEEEEEEIEDLEMYNYLPEEHENNIPTSRGPLQQKEKENESSSSIRSNDISEIEPNFLYLSGYQSAGKPEILKQYQITYVINASGSNCPNKGDSSIKYLTLNLNDNIRENIECIFYMCIDFINECKNSNGKVLVHCYKGVSRSVSIVLAYLIYTYRKTVEESLELIQTHRRRADPNIGFYLQLELFYKRLNDKNEKIKKFSVFFISYFSLKLEDYIVARLYFSELDNQNKLITVTQELTIDDRGVYIICNVDKVYILIGKQTADKTKNHFVEFAYKYINKIKECEHIANGEPTLIEQEIGEKEVVAFAKENNTLLTIKKNIDISKYYIDLETEYFTFPEIKDESEYVLKKAFFFYPNEVPFKVLDLDFLTNDEFLVACSDNGVLSVMYIWKGLEFKESQEEIERYIDYIKKSFFTFLDIEPPKNGGNIIEINELPFEESEDFMALL